MKGQYFSFDAVIAAVIMVLAFTTLLSYWFSLQYVVESRTLSLRTEAARIAESLLSQGSPSDWQEKPIEEVRQIGLASDYGAPLSQEKIARLSELEGGSHASLCNLFRSPARFYIEMRQSDALGAEAPLAAIGQTPVLEQNPSEVAMVHRGAVLEGRPVSLKVTLWESDDSPNCFYQ